MILLPVTATVLAGLLALKNPDSLITQVLAVFPPTAPAALSARLVLTETSTWEVLAAYLLLLVSIWLMRTVAGKIFHLGVLMYGKEPSFKELVRWIRET
jgi:ABC-2 type transport system permease protein